MTSAASTLSRVLKDPTAAALLGHVGPWWLWSADARQLIATNEAGAAAMGASGPSMAVERDYGEAHPLASQIARLAPNLPADGTPRMERLRLYRRLGSDMVVARARRVSGDAIAVTVETGQAPTRAAAAAAITTLAAPAILFADGGGALARTASAPEIGDIRLNTLLGSEAAEVQSALDASGVATVDLVTGPLALVRVPSLDTTLAIFAPSAPVAVAPKGPRLVDISPMATREIVPAAAAPVVAVQLVSAPKPSIPVEREAGPAPVAAPPNDIPAPAKAPELAMPPEDTKSAPKIERITWRTDGAGRFLDVKPGEAAALVGMTLAEAAERFGLADMQALTKALASERPFGGVSATWPLMDGWRAAVTVSGFPRPARAGVFEGFSGLARVEEINAVAATPVAADLTTVDTTPADAAPISSASDDVAPAVAKPEVQFLAPDTIEPAVERLVPDAAPQTEPVLAPIKAAIERLLDEASEVRSPPTETPRPAEPTPPLPVEILPGAPPPTGARDETPRAEPIDALRDEAPPQPVTRVPPKREKPPEQQVAARGEPNAARDRDAFAAIARALGGVTTPSDRADTRASETQATPVGREALEDGALAQVLDRLSEGVVVHRGNAILHVNKPVLEWTGFADARALERAGGLARVFAGEPVESAGRLAVVDGDGKTRPVEARLLRVTWGGEPAMMFALTKVDDSAGEAVDDTVSQLRDRLDEVEAILDTATDGVVLVSPEGRIASLNRAAEALFGYEAADVTGKAFTTLFAPESHRSALDYLDGLVSNGVASVLNDGREIIGRVRQGGLVPLYMTMGRAGAGPQAKLAAVFRDLTQWKKAEEDLVAARKQAEAASVQKSDFLARISHEIRTPLNAIIGFSEIMMEERFGPLGNERYRDYLRDVHAAGGHVLSLINDLLDLSKIEAGKMDLSFTSVDLNDIVQSQVAIMQPQANRERVIIRSSLQGRLPNVVADARSLRQIVLNLLSNSVKFTPAGGQIIVSTALSDGGEAILRVRDTGVGMTNDELRAAMEPFRQVATVASKGGPGTGLGLPLTKALVEANRASFGITSTPRQGTLVEVIFPPTRVLAE